MVNCGARAVALRRESACRCTASVTATSHSHGWPAKPSSGAARALQRAPRLRQCCCRPSAAPPMRGCLDGSERSPKVICHTRC